MISFDSEDDSKGKIYMINFFDGINHFNIHHKKFKTRYELQSEAIKYISMSDEKIFVAHNLEYDMINLFYPFFIDQITFYYSGRLLYARLKNSQKVFIDSFNFSFSSLKSIGKEIKLEKMESENFDNIEYCKRDCEIVHVFMSRLENQLLKEFECKLKYTIAGTAFNLYCQNFLKHDILNINDNDEILNCYYGGRTEVFKIGEIDRYLYQVDVNSMYPFVMLNQFPISAGYETKNPDSKFFITRAKITINNKTDIPVIPYRQELLLFPTGTFTSWITSIELETAYKYKQVKKIEYLQTINFSEMDFIFTEFVKYFYTQREQYKKENNNFMSNFYKRFLNSVYGRFALKSDLSIISKSDGNNFNKNLLHNMTTKKLNIPKQNVNYIIPVFITAFSRVVLFELYQKIKSFGGVIAYSDTDSVYFYFDNKKNLSEQIETIYNHLPINNSLGALSLEAYQGGGFFNAKSYRVDYFDDIKFKYVQKGIPEKNRYEYQTTGKTSYLRPQKLRPALRGVLSQDAGVWYEHIMSKKTEYRKRTVSEKITENLSDTVPLVI